MATFARLTVTSPTMAARALEGLTEDRSAVPAAPAKKCRRLNATFVGAENTFAGMDALDSAEADLADFILVSFERGGVLGFGVRRSWGTNRLASIRTLEGVILLQCYLFVSDPLYSSMYSTNLEAVQWARCTPSSKGASCDGEEMVSRESKAAGDLDGCNGLKAANSFSIDIAYGIGYNSSTCVDYSVGLERARGLITANCQRTYR